MESHTCNGLLTQLKEAVESETKQAFYYSVLLLQSFSGKLLSHGNH